MKRNRGFTLMEMLIVVAIIAVLAAVAIPVFNGSLHKAKVAADMANVRAYYAELQTQYITTGEYIDIGDDMHLNWRREIKFLDGTTVQMQAGTVSAILARERTDRPAGRRVRPLAIRSTISATRATTHCCWNNDEKRDGVSRLFSYRFFLASSMSSGYLDLM